MKKLLAALLIGTMSISLLAGCGKTQETEEPSVVEPSVQEVETVPVETIEEEPNHDGQAQSYLTGEWIDAELAEQRPLAVMIGNTEDACPHNGISQADVIYEAPVESDITRLMCIFQDYQNVEKIESLRSCRLYYIDWALEFDAIYCHYGQAYLAEDMLSKDYVNNLSGLDGSLNSIFARDSSRKAPHNAYTTGEGIVKGIEIKGYETKHSEDYTSHYQFTEEADDQITLTDGMDAAVVKPGYRINKPWFEYDESTGLYTRYQYGTAETDGNNGETVTVKNILIQLVDDCKVLDKKGRLSLNTQCGGKGYYITNGKAVEVTWSKDSQTAPTKYFTEDGNEITLNQGKTWVCIVKGSNEDNVSITAAEE